MKYQRRSNRIVEVSTHRLDFADNAYRDNCRLLVFANSEDSQEWLHILLLLLLDYRDPSWANYHF
jgi:hypothetical protein